MQKAISIISGCALCIAMLFSLSACACSGTQAAALDTAPSMWYI